MPNTKPQFITPACPRCGSPLKQVKDKSYFGCPNWRPNKMGCDGTIWYPDGQRKREYPNKLFSCKVESQSHPGHYHIVTVYESGDIDCPCMASSMGKFCHHQKVVVEKVKQILEKIKENHLAGVPV